MGWDGDYRIYCGDCFEVLSQLDITVDAIITDMPYGVTGLEWDVPVSLDDWWELAHSVLKEDGVFITTAINPFAARLVLSNESEFRYDWVWNKRAGSNMMHLRYMPWRIHELVLVFARSTRFTFNPIKARRTSKSLVRNPPGSIIRKGNVGMYGIERKPGVLSEWRYPVSIIEHGVHEAGRYRFKHPTKKPVALFKYLVQTYTSAGDVVLDPFMGSGTTGVAALELGRRFIGVEKEQEYFEIAKRRIERAAMQLPLPGVFGGAD